MGITELDDVEAYRTILSQLIEEKDPVGVLEMVLIKSVALDMLRWQRAKRLEAEYITGELNPPIHGPSMLSLIDFESQGQMLDPGLPAAISSESVQRLVGTFQRYESVIANRLFRTLHELERSQRSRMGEHVPAPVAVDVNIHAPSGAADSVDDRTADLVSVETGALGSAPKAPEETKAPSNEGRSLREPAIVDFSVRVETEELDSVPRLENAPPDDEE